ncbi:MAG: hypothetical protein Q4D04_08130, partial [Clostridia bacterium]|nr:hypothetical protein [Clostridia bacterium]
MKRRDFIIIAVVVVIAVGLLLYWNFGRTIQPIEGTPTGTLEMVMPETAQTTEQPAPTAEPTPAPTSVIMGFLSPSAAAEDATSGVDSAATEPETAPEAEAETESPSDVEATPRPTLYPAESYLRVATSTGEFDLVPLVGEAQFRLTQGEGIENVIEVGVNRVKMHSSTCDNQDCVNQGEITL